MENLSDQDRANKMYFDSINKNPTKIAKPGLLMIDDNCVKYVNETISLE
jgi:hypothetical protein